MSVVMRTLRSLMLYTLPLSAVAVPAFAADVDATLQWYRKAVLSTPVSGVVTAVNIAQGDKVKKGQVLVQLDDRVYKAKVEAQKAALKRAENNRDEAQRELDRVQELYDRTVLAQHDLQVGIIQRDAAVAEYHEAVAALAKAEQNFEYSAIRAPFSGYVASLQTHQGQVIVSDLQAAPMVKVVEAGRMLARAAVAETELAKLKMGAGAKVTVAGKTYSAKVDRIALEPVKAGTTQYHVYFVFDTGGRLYRSGQTATVSY